MRATIASSTSSDAGAVLARGQHRIVSGQADDILDFLPDLFASAQADRSC